MLGSEPPAQGRTWGAKTAHFAAAARTKKRPGPRGAFKAGESGAAGLNLFESCLMSPQAPAGGATVEGAHPEWRECNEALEGCHPD